MKNNTEKVKIKEAFEFFKKKLNLDVDVYLEFSHFLKDKQKAIVVIKRNSEKYKFFVRVNDNKWYDLDSKITSLAHEMVHIYQIISGKLDPFNKTWMGKTVSTSNYHHLPWESDARVEGHKLWIEFNRSLLKENLTPENNSFFMYHGGSKWFTRPQVQPAKKNRYEGGVGIYLTNNYLTARKYAKGGKVVHLVEVDKNFKDITQVNLSLPNVISFLKNLNGLKNREQIISDINRFCNRVKKQEFPAEILNNLIVNWESGTGKMGLEIVKYFISNGIDAYLYNQSGEEQWLIVFNPRIIKKTTIQPSNIDVNNYMLPRISK